MKVQRFCLRSFLQHFLLCCVISSLLCCSISFDSYAATTIVDDVNGDGLITVDEVDLVQLATYSLVTGWGVTGSNLTEKITSSSAYLSTLEEISGYENEVVLAEFDGLNLHFTSDYVAFCASIFDELSDPVKNGYQILPKVSKDDLILKLDELYSLGSMSSADYSTIFNKLNSDDFTYDVVYFYSNGTFNIYFQMSDYYPANYVINDYYFNYANYDLSGSLSTGSIESQYYQVYKSGYMTTSGTSPFGLKEGSEILYSIDSSIIVFQDIVSVTKYTSMEGYIYYNSSASRDCNNHTNSIKLINANDWSDVNNNLYNIVSTAVMDANNATYDQIQNIIDQELEDISEYISDGSDSSDGDESDPGTEGDQESVLGDKLDQNNALQEENNQLQQESNQLQEENNALQEESNQLQEESNALQEEENETSKGILGKITEFFGSFFQNLIDSVVGIFVPDQEDMQANFERLDQFFSDTFGFLYYPFDFLIEAVNIFLSADSGTSLTFPGFSIMGHEVWSDQSFDLTSIDVVNTIFETVRLVTGGVLAFAFINYLRSFFDKRFGGGGA